MLVVNRFDLEDMSAEQFNHDAKAALQALSACTGFVRGRVGASMDDPQWRVLVTEWDSVGSYRRALSNFDVKMYGTPLLSRALAEPAAFEISIAADGNQLSEYSSDRASGMGRRASELSPHDNEAPR